MIIVSTSPSTPRRLVTGQLFLDEGMRRVEGCSSSGIGVRLNLRK
jgi:hypothetical protein